MSSELSRMANSITWRSLKTILVRLCSHQYTLLRGSSKKFFTVSIDTRCTSISNSSEKRKRAATSCLRSVGSNLNDIGHSVIGNLAWYLHTYIHPSNHLQYLREWSLLPCLAKYHLCG